MRGFESKSKWISEVKEIELLESWIEFGKPESGSDPLAWSPLPSKAPIGRISDNSFSRYIGCNKFSELPLSKKTKDALNELKFTKMTPIQRASIPHALYGHNIIGASKTGTGKSLAFIIPVLEKLYRMRWGPEDGIGSIIISPTRELAYQLYQVLNSVGKHHSFGAALLMGGRKDVETEKKYVNKLNILVCTPGRLLHHMNATPNFDCSHLQVLVLDEADRILGCEFQNELDAIISQLPEDRQTLLFSATLTNSSKGLRRVRLKDPEYLNVDQKSVTATPKRLLEETYIVPLDQKLDFLWSFIRQHKKSTILVFFSTRKQVKFAFEVFKKLGLGIPLTCLYGKMNVDKRMHIYSRFCEQPSVLFATDVAGRGLEFTKRVDWVVQVDCPDNFEIYTHRVGRTARNHSAGNSVLFLMPSEMKMLNKLQEHKVPIWLSSKSNPEWLETKVSKNVAGLLVKYDNLQLLAQRAFVTYLKSINKKQDNDVFDVMKLPIDEFSASLGLPMTPKVRFLNKKTKIKAMAVETPSLHPEICSAENMLEFQKRRSILNLKEDEVEDAILIPKENPCGAEATTLQTGDVFLTTSMASKKKRKKLKINPHRPTGIRTVFDTDGEGLPPLATLAEMKTGSGRNTSVQVDIDTVNRRFVEMREEMKQRDKEDKLRDRLCCKDQRHRDKRKRRLRKEDMAERDYLSDPNDEGGVVNKKKKLYFDSENEDEDSGDIHYSYDRLLGVSRAADSVSLAEQEKLALKLLSSMHS